MKNLSDFREEYRKGELHESEMLADPLEQFKVWMDDAINSHLSEPNAMAVATSTPDGKPSIRVVLLKEVNERGFVFYTNYRSRKGREIEKNPQASIVFDWHPIERQVRIEGKVLKVSAEESDRYFDSRPEGSKIGAWVSPQSEIVENREALDKMQEETERRFEGKTIVRPPHWGGYIVIPEVVEFWQGRPSRLHDRVAYCKTEDGWQMKRMAP